MAQAGAAKDSANKVLTRSGLPLRLQRLTGEAASARKWTALMPYSWTNARFCQVVAHSWQVRAASAAAGTAVSWRCGRWWPGLLCLLLLPPAVERSLQLLLWLINTRQLPDYSSFADYWSSEQNRLYGAFVDGGKPSTGDGAEAGEFVGTVASLHLDGELCELQRLGVLEAFRGHGVGDALCRFLMADCAARGYKRMQLGTTALQQHAISIYERLGFTRVDQFRSPMLPGIPIYRYEICLETYLSGLD